MYIDEIVSIQCVDVFVRVDRGRALLMRANKPKQLSRAPDLFLLAPYGLFIMIIIVLSQLYCVLLMLSLFSLFTDCTKSLPNLTEEEMASGLATKILVELVTREDSEQKHFSALFFSLLPERFETSIDVSSLQAADLLRKKSITSAKLIQRLISLGMKVNEADVSSAVQVLKENHKKALQLLLKECARTRKSTFTSACQEAIRAKKLQFVSCLIENGGAPDVEDLKDLTGWPQAKVDPVIDAYLQDNVQPRKKAAPKREVPPPAGLPDRASALVSLTTTDQSNVARESL